MEPVFPISALGGLPPPRRLFSSIGRHCRNDLDAFGQLTIEALLQLRLAAGERVPRSGKFGRRGREPLLEFGAAAGGVLARAYELPLDLAFAARGVLARTHERRS